MNTQIRLGFLIATVAAAMSLRVFGDTGTGYTASAPYSSWSGTVGTASYKQPAYQFTAGDYIVGCISFNDLAGGTLNGTAPYGLYLMNVNSSFTSSGSHVGTVVTVSCGGISQSVTLVGYTSGFGSGALVGNMNQNPFMSWTGTTMNLYCVLKINGLTCWTIGGGTPPGPGGALGQSGTGGLSVLSWTVTNNSQGLQEYGIFNWPAGVSQTVSNSTGIVIDPRTLAAGASGTWTMTVGQSDSSTYALEPVNYAATVSTYGQSAAFYSGAVHSTNSDGSISFDFTYGYGVPNGLPDTPEGWASGSAFSGTTPATNSSITQAGLNLGVSDSGISPPSTVASSSTTATTVTATNGSATTATAGPGTGGASDAGIQDAANAINTQINATGNNIIANNVTQSNAASSSVVGAVNAASAQAHSDAGALNGAIGSLGTIIAASGGSGGSGSIVSAVNALQTENHTDLGSGFSTLATNLNGINTDLTTGTVGSALTAAANAAAAGSGGVSSAATTDLAGLQSAVGTALGGSGTIASNGTFTGTGVGTSDTGAANGFLGGGTPDEPFGTVQLSPAIRSLPAQSYTLSMSSSVGGMLGPLFSFCGLIMAWGSVLWFIFALQNLAYDAAKVIPTIPSNSVLQGPETMAVPGAAYIKGLAVAAAWVVAAGAAWAVIVALVNNSISGNSISITTAFQAASVGSSVPSFLGTWGGNFIGWLNSAGGLSTTLILLASYWVIKWQMSAILFGVAAFLRSIEA